MKVTIYMIKLQNLKYSFILFSKYRIRKLNCGTFRSIIVIVVVTNILYFDYIKVN